MFSTAIQIYRRDARKNDCCKYSSVVVVACMSMRHAKICVMAQLHWVCNLRTFQESLKTFNGDRLSVHGELFARCCLLFATVNLYSNLSIEQDVCL